MPKKYQSENKKAIAAKERKTLIENQKQLKQQEAEDDASWQETNKLIKKKQQRKDEQSKKREQQLQKKAQTKLLLDQEVSSIKSSKNYNKQQTCSSSSAKITRAEIENYKKKQCENPKKDNVIDDLLLTENVNRCDDGTEDARTVNEAIAILSVNDAKDIIDKHPEKRKKAAYTQFESRRLKELKLENSELRMSQLKEVVFKEWNKSPENPLNRTQI